MRSADLVSPARHLAVRRFAIAWRNRTRRSIHHVAVLDADGGVYRFRYLDGVGEVDGFRPFIGFPDLTAHYESRRLWPFFDLRVMDRKRPDYPQYLKWLGLPLDSDRLDVLSRSGGQQKGDTVLLAESPFVANDGTTATTFLARGTRFAVDEFQSAATVSNLNAGDRLGLRDDEENEANPDAILLTSGDGQPVGWVPDLLIAYTRDLRQRDVVATVLQNNGPDAPAHLRLLVRLVGTVSPGTRAFYRGSWPE